MNVPGFLGVRSGLAGSLIAWAIVNFGIAATAVAHDDVHGRPHFKGIPASPTAVMHAFMADVKSAQSLLPANNIACIGGFADIYPCHNVDLLAFLPLADIGGGGALGSGNDVWGWTDPVSAREFALFGRNDGTAFVEITDPINPVYLGKLPTHTDSSSWRDIKVYADHAFIVSEAYGHGMQVFDLSRLLVADPATAPHSFTDDAQYSGFGNAHNIVIDEDSGIAYAVGTNTCSRGLHMVDIGIPTIPTFAGCFGGDGYTHDAQCVTYAGPDPDYQNGEEICFAANGDTLTIVDVTNKAAPAQLSRTDYSGRGYTHQAWLSDDQSLLFLDDELDERNFGHGTKTRVWDVSDLEAPLVIDEFTNITDAIDHNLYVKGDRLFQANYRAGLTVLEIVRDQDDNYLMLDELAYFDVYPSSDSANFNGAWSTYPYFPSGTIVVSGIEQGLFVLALNIPDEVAFVSPGENAVLSGNAVPIEIFARDGDPDAVPPVVQWRVEGGSLQDAPSLGANLFAAVWDTRGMNNGVYYLTAVMVDASGAQTAAAISVEVRNSDNLPTAWFTNPIDGATVKGNTTLIATAIDDGAVVSVTFFDDGNEIGTDSDPAGGWSVKWNTKKVSQGVHTLTVEALDDGNQFSDPAADNNGTVSVTVGSGSGNGGGENGGKKCHPKKDPDCIR